MFSTALVLTSSILLFLYTLVLGYYLYRHFGDWQAFSRGIPLRLLQFTPVLILLTLAVALYPSVFLLGLMCLLVAGFFFFLHSAKESQEASRENVVDLPSPPVVENANGAASKLKRMIEPAYYRFQSRRAVLSDGVEIGYVETGRGPTTLLFVHGLGSNRKCWQKNILQLRQYYRCIAIDLPGYGVSSKGKHSYTMYFFAEKLREFIRVLALRDLVLAGHSMGGQIVMTALLQDPYLASRLILLAPAGFETFSATEKALVRSFYQPALIRATPTEQIRRNFEANFFQFPADAEFMIEDRLELRSSDDHLHYSRMIPKCMIAMMEEPVFHRLSGIHLPTLVLFGANDQLIPNRMMHPGMDTLAVAEAGAARLPNSRLEIMRPCGHFVQWECADAVNRSIRRFLK